MYRPAAIKLVLLAAGLAAFAALAETGDTAQRLAGRALGDTPMLSDLRELCDRIGGRPTGSPACERAIDWAAAKFKAAGADVSVESFPVPNRWAAISAEARCLAPEEFASAWRPHPGRHPRTESWKLLLWMPVTAAQNHSASWAPPRTGPSRWSGTRR